MLMVRNCFPIQRNPFETLLTPIRQEILKSTPPLIQSCLSLLLR